VCYCDSEKGMENQVILIEESKPFIPNNSKVFNPLKKLVFNLFQFDKKKIKN
jgi:hypothetical protein